MVNMLAIILKTRAPLDPALFFLATMKVMMRTRKNLASLTRIYVL